MSPSPDDIPRNGWTAVPVDASVLLKGKAYLHEPKPVRVEDIKFPSDDPVVSKVYAYAKERLSRQTFNHSMRVFYYGIAIVNQQFPDHASTFSPSTYALSCLLHDIGATDENIAATHMSFEFYGGVIALNLLTELGAPRDQAEAVCETIIRHQDLGTVGNITFLGQVIQLATIYDNVTEHPDIPDYKNLLAEQTRDDVNAKFPREGWLGCFASIIRKETGLKPWCHTTHIHNFDKLVEGNKVMRKYE